MENADCVLLIGGNPASNHPRMMRTLMMVRRKGGKVIVVNPIVETGLVNFSVPSDAWALLFGAEIASTYVQPHVGGDLALVYGIMKRLREIHAARPINAAGEPVIDEEFLRENCTGWPELAARLDALSWEEIAAASGVSRREIEAIAGQYAESRRAIFAWTMGVTHHLHGAATVQAIAALALMRRMVGRPGAGLQPIRGHSNIQGMGTVGVTPTLKQALFDRLQSHYGVSLPTMKGYDTLECLDAADAGRMRLAVCLGGNLYGASPDAAFAARALGKLDMLVSLNTSLNTGHAWGTAAEETIILPVLARDEEPEPSTQARVSHGRRPRPSRRPRPTPGPRGPAIDDDPQRGAVQHRGLRGGGPVPQPDAARHRPHPSRRHRPLRPRRRRPLPGPQCGRGDARPDRLRLRPDPDRLRRHVLPREQRPRAQGGRPALADARLQEHRHRDRPRRRRPAGAPAGSRDPRRRHAQGEDEPVRLTLGTNHGP